MKNWNIFFLLLIVLIGFVVAQDGNKDKDVGKQEEKKGDNNNGDKQGDQGKKEEKKEEKQEDKKEEKKEDNKDQKKEDNKDEKKDDNKDQKQDDKKEDKKDSDKDNVDTGKISYKDTVELKVSEPLPMQYTKLMYSFNDKIKFKWSWDSKKPPKKRVDTLKLTLVDQGTASRPVYLIDEFSASKFEYEWDIKKYNDNETNTKQLSEGRFQLFLHDGNKTYDAIPKLGELRAWSTYITLYKTRTPNNDYNFSSSATRYSVLSVTFPLVATLGLIGMLHAFI